MSKQISKVHLLEQCFVCFGIRFGSTVITTSFQLYCQTVNHLVLRLYFSSTRILKSFEILARNIILEMCKHHLHPGRPVLIESQIATAVPTYNTKWCIGSVAANQKAKTTVIQLSHRKDAVIKANVPCCNSTIWSLLRRDFLSAAY